MSGGYFEYREYAIAEIAESVHELIIYNHTPDEEGYIRAYPEYIIEEFKQAERALKRAAIYVKNIDYLISGDNGEESFVKYLFEELNEHN